MSLEEMVEKSLELNRFQQIAAPILGKSILYDGRSGEAFDQTDYSWLRIHAQTNPLSRRQNPC